MKHRRLFFINWTIFSLFLGGIALLTFFILGTFFDQQISQWFLPHHEDNFFGLYFSLFGYGIYTFPLIIILAICRNFWLLKSRKTFTTEREVGVWALILLLFIFLDSVGLFKRHTPFAIITWIIVICTYLWIYALVIWYFRQTHQVIKTRNGHYHLQTFLAIFIYIIGAYLTTFIFKVLFVRPRIMTIEAGEADYHAWWNVSWNPYRFKNNSFPSGHVTIALSLLSLIYLLKPRSQSHFWASLGIWVFAIIMACSRIVYNQHYLTDTIMSMIISICWFYFGKWIKDQQWLARWDFYRPYVHCQHQHNDPKTSSRKVAK